MSINILGVAYLCVLIPVCGAVSTVIGRKAPQSLSWFVGWMMLVSGIALWSVFPVVGVVLCLLFVVFAVVVARGQDSVVDVRAVR